MKKKRQWIQLIVILMSCSFLFILAGCNSSCMDECAVSDCDNDMTAQGVSIPGICFDSHKFMAGSMNTGALEEEDEKEDDDEIYFVSVDSTIEDGCFGCVDCYVIGGCKSVDSWGCMFGTVDEESGNEESWIGCADGNMETKDTGGCGFMMIKSLESGIGID